MKVADLMTKDVQSVRDDANIADVILTLAESHVHAVPVLNGRGQFVGVLSTSDVLEAAAETASAGEREDLFNRTLVRDIMTTLPRTIAPDDDARDAAQQMFYLDVHRLFVTVNKELVGVISQSDLVRAIATANI